VWRNTREKLRDGPFTFPRLRIGRNLEIMRRGKVNRRVVTHDMNEVFGALTPSTKRQRRRTGPTQADLLRTIRAAQAAGWHSVEIEQPCGTIIRLRPGAAEHVETPNSRGLRVVP
jgi:hypothetical protein